MNLISAYIIYDGRTNSYVDNGTVVTINCEMLSAFTPRPVWLQRWLPSGDGTDIIYQPTFELTSAEQLQYGDNLIQGVWVQQGDAGMIVDVVDVNTIISACDQCCDNSPAVTLARFYTGGIPLFSTPTEALFCISRNDDGSVSAATQFAIDYAGQTHGAIKIRSSLSGTTTYQVTSFAGWQPVMQGTDTVVAGGCP